MFERFSDRARRVVVLAQEEARILHHNSIGTEHILLGLLAENEGIAAQVLHSLDVNVEDARAQVREIIGHGGTAPSGHIPFTPRAKKVLELSLREALQLGHNYIGTEHILLGLVREGEGVAARVLETLGADLGRVRHAVIEVLSASAREPTTPPVGGASFPPQVPARPRCSLCGRSEDRVEHLLVSRGVLVCDGCVRAAAAQLDALPHDAPKWVRLRRSDVGPDDDQEARTAIVRAFEAIFGPTHLPIEDAFWAVEGGADREAPLREMEEAAQHAPAAVNDITVEQVRFVDEAEAEVSLGFWMAGSPSPLLMPARAVLHEGDWKVSRSTIEQFAQLAQTHRRPD